MIILHKQDEVEQARLKQQELLAAAATPQHHHLEETEQDETNDTAANGDVSRDLATSDEPIVDPVEDRRTIAEKNERLQSQLKVRVFFLMNKKKIYMLLQHSLYSLLYLLSPCGY